MIIASKALLVIAIVSVLWGVASALMIAAALQNRGVKINWIWFRVFLVSRYLDQYRDITRRETGRTGRLFYSYLIAMMVALVTVIVGLVLRRL